MARKSLRFTKPLGPAHALYISCTRLQILCVTCAPAVMVGIFEVFLFHLTEFLSSQPQLAAASDIFVKQANGKENRALSVKARKRTKKDRKSRSNKKKVVSKSAVSTAGWKAPVKLLCPCKERKSLGFKLQTICLVIIHSVV